MLDRHPARSVSAAVLACVGSLSAQTLAIEFDGLSYVNCGKLLYPRPDAASIVIDGGQRVLISGGEGDLQVNHSTIAGGEMAETFIVP